MQEIPLRNKKGEVVAKALVDAEDFAAVNQFKWSIIKKGKVNYVHGHVNERVVYLHRFLMKPKSKFEIVDHIDNNPMNNRRRNLRIVTRSQNNQNKVKRAGGTSKYKGVSWNKNIKQWELRIAGKVGGYYEKEEHAAYAYDLKVVKVFGVGAKLNNVSEPSGFTLWVPKNKPRDTNGGAIKKTKGGKYLVTIQISNKNTYLGTYGSLSLAETVRAEAVKTKITQIQNNILSKPILRNTDGQALIPLSTNPLQYAIVDDEDYPQVILLTWCLSNGYPTNSASSQSMSRFLIKPTNTDTVVDHINWNKLDHRKSNLREITENINAYNRRKSENASSAYRGVRVASGKYAVQIVHQFKNYSGGTYEDEIVAAYTADCLATQLYGDYALLNNVQQPTGWMYDKDTRRSMRINEPSDEIGNTIRITPVSNQDSEDNAMECDFELPSQTTTESNSNSTSNISNEITVLNSTSRKKKRRTAVEEATLDIIPNKRQKRTL